MAKQPNDRQLLKDVMLAPPVHISANHLRILAVMDRGPTYGRKLLDEHPRLFTSGKVAHDGSLVVEARRAYQALKRMLDRGFVEVIPDYRPPGVPVKGSFSGKTKAKWYRITRQGREVLAENRQSINKA